MSMVSPRKRVSLVKMCLSETYCRVRVGKHLSDMFSIKNGLERRYYLSLLLFNFTLLHAIRRVQGKQDGLKLNSTHQFMVYAEDVNLADGRIHTMKKNTKALVVDSKEIALEVNDDKTKYMAMDRDQNTVRSHNTKTDNSSFERAEQFRYFGTTLKNRNSVVLSWR